MSDVRCPYCKAEEYICHDDGYGMEEGVAHQQQCEHCDKHYIFYTAISLDYDVSKAACLNGESEHQWKVQRAFPIEYSRMKCWFCHKERKMTDVEQIQLIGGEL